MSRITQRGINGPLALTANGQFQQQAQTIQQYAGTVSDPELTTLLGSRWDLEDGREVKLILAGASNLSAGQLMTAPAWIANHQNCAVTATQAYSNNGNTPATVTLTLGATAVTANQYRGGYLVVNDNTGQGQTLKIASHPAANASASLVVTLEDAPNTALDTTSEVCLVASPCNGVIVSDASNLQQPVGVTLYPITAAYYGFIMSKGVVSCLNDGALTTGSAVSASNAVAGAVENGVIAQGFVGFAIQTGVDTEYRPIFVDL